MKNITRLYVTVVLLILFSCDEPIPGSGSVENIEVGKIIQRDLVDIKQMSPMDSIDRAQINAHFVESIGQLETMKIFRSMDVSEDDSQQINFVLIPVGQILDSTLMIVSAFADGTIDKVRFLGGKAINEDKDASYENFYRQFSGRRIDYKNTFGEDDFLKMVAEMDDRTSYMYHHARLMINKNYILRHGMRVTGQDKNPKIEWLESMKDELKKMEEDAHLLDHLTLSSAIETYKSEAIYSADAMEEMMEDARNNASPSVIRGKILDFRKVNCGGCHSIESNDPQLSLKDQLKKSFKEQGKRDDIFIAGFDIWEIPDMPQESQKLSNIIKAALFGIHLSTK